MPRLLVRRAGTDTLVKLEAAARQRYREGERLLALGEHLGAVYLFGYTVEMRLKAAYYRTIGLTPATPIDHSLHRKPAESAIKLLPQLPMHPGVGGPAAGHHIVGWARLLETTRAQAGHPLAPALASAMHVHAEEVFLRWAEFLRYRANRPYDREVECVRAAAAWFAAHARRLWS